MEDPILSTSFAVSLFVLLVVFFFMLRATQQKRFIMQKLKQAHEYGSLSKAHRDIHQAVKRPGVKKKPKRSRKKRK